MAVTLDDDALTTHLSNRASAKTRFFPKGTGSNVVPAAIERLRRQASPLKRGIAERREFPRIARR